MRKNRVNGWRCMWCLLAMFVAVGTAHGDIIQFQFSGVVTEIRPIYPVDEMLDEIVQVGDPYTAIFTFDTDAPDQRPEDPSLGLYDGPSAILIMPNLTIQATSSLGVHNEVAGDCLYFFMPFTLQHFSIDLRGASSGYLTSDALPPAVELEAFAGPKSFELFLGHNQIIGSVVIPEPGTLSLFFVGVLGFWVRRRRC